MRTNGGAGERSYGPESITIGGNLKPGTYAVMVHVHTKEGADMLAPEESRFHGGCATVSVYSVMLGGTAPEGKFTWTVSEEDHLVADWWHVFNLEVKSELEPLGYGYAESARTVKKVLVHNVNQMLRPGLLVDDDTGMISGNFAVAPHSLSEPAWLNEYQAHVGKVIMLLPIRQYEHITLRAREEKEGRRAFCMCLRSNVSGVVSSFFFVSCARL